MKGKILWIEGRRIEAPPFIAALRKKGYQVETVSTGNEALEIIRSSPPSLVVINAASLRSSGKRICLALRKEKEFLPILVITAAGQGAPNGDCASVVLVLPFTSRKLINRITPLIPSQSNLRLQAGPILLDMDLRRVTCQGRETQLTPRLAALLKALMQNPGEVVDRQGLFREVWNTGYTGDTRTLDVHISWLRQAIEEDPKNPKILKTIRGAGYRLDI